MSDSEDSDAESESEEEEEETEESGADSDEDSDENSDDEDEDGEGDEEDEGDGEEVPKEPEPDLTEGEILQQNLSDIRDVSFNLDWVLKDIQHTFNPMGVFRPNPARHLPLGRPRADEPMHPQLVDHHRRLTAPSQPPAQQHVSSVDPHGRIHSALMPRQDVPRPTEYLNRTSTVARNPSAYGAPPTLRTRQSGYQIEADVEANRIRQLSLDEARESIRKSAERATFGSLYRHHKPEEHGVHGPPRRRASSRRRPSARRSVFSNPGKSQISDNMLLRQAESLLVGEPVAEASRQREYSQAIPADNPAGSFIIPPEPPQERGWNSGNVNNGPSLTSPRYSSRQRDDRYGDASRPTRQAASSGAPRYNAGGLTWDVSELYKSTGQGVENIADRVGGFFG